MESGFDVVNDEPLEPEPASSILYNPYEGVNWNSVEHYKANFHTHTTESDGSLTPSQVIDEYYNANYKILSLTDHDTMEGTQTTWS